MRGTLVGRSLLLRPALPQQRARLSGRSAGGLCRTVEKSGQRSVRKRQVVSAISNLPSADDDLAEKENRRT